MFYLKNGEAYQKGTGIDKVDIIQLLANYMTRFGGRKPTPEELSGLGKDEELPQDLNLYSTHYANFDEAVKKAGFYVPKNNPAVVERNDFIRRATDLLVARGVKEADLSSAQGVKEYGDLIVSELKISDGLMKKYFNGISDLVEEAKPGLRAAEVRRRMEMAKVRKEQEAAAAAESEKKQKEITKQMKEKNKESNREDSGSSKSLTSRINVPAVPVVADKVESNPSSDSGDPDLEYDAVEVSEYNADDFEAYDDSVSEELDSDPELGSELKSEAEGETKPEPEAETKLEAETEAESKTESAGPVLNPVVKLEVSSEPKVIPKSNHGKKKKRGGDSEKIEISYAELDEIASILDMNGSVLKNYYLLCQHRGYVVLQGELAKTTTLLREKKRIREVLPCWDFLKKTFGPSCLYNELFGLPFKERHRTVSRAESQKAQLSPEELENHNVGKQRLQEFLDSNWENSHTRRKPNRFKEANSGVATKVQQIAERVSSEAEEQEKKVVADVPVETKEEDMVKNETETTEETREEERIKENNFPNKKDNNAKVSVIKVGNGMVRVTITREPITMMIPEGVHINMNVSLPEETVNVVI